MQGTGGPLGDDPGWRRDVGGFVAGRQKAGDPRVAPLAQLRTMLVVFTIGLLGCGVVTLVIAPADDGEGLAAPVAAGVVVAVGVVGWLLTPLLGPRLDCSTAETLVTTYRTRFFLRMAIAEAAALTGFAVALVAYQPWPYFLGLAFTLVGFLRAAPTERNLARDQDALAVAGCAHPLAATLRATPGPIS